MITGLCDQTLDPRLVLSVLIVRSFFPKPDGAQKRFCQLELFVLRLRRQVEHHPHSTKSPAFPPGLAVCALRRVRTECAPRPGSGAVRGRSSGTERSPPTASGR